MKRENSADCTGKPKTKRRIKHITLKPQYIPANFYPSAHPPTEPIIANNVIKKEK